MVRVVINSFQCFDEQDGPDWSGSDEVYFEYIDFYSNGVRAYDHKGYTTESVDAGDKFFPEREQQFFAGNRDTMYVKLWENDHGELRGGDDAIGDFVVPESLNGTGQHTARCR